jgi:hypothetical protein
MNLEKANRKGAKTRKDNALQRTGDSPSGETTCFRISFALLSVFAPLRL